MALADAPALLALLSAPSKSAVDEFLCCCAAEREQLRPPDAERFGQIAATFGGLSLADAKRLQKAGVELVTKLVYLRAGADGVMALLGEGFHADLAALIGKVAAHRVEAWRAESLSFGGVSSMPRLEHANWQVYRKPAAASPTVLLSLGLEGGASSGGARVADVEMSKEQLEALCLSLGKVKQQLESV
jgi:hypothetical protein